MLSRGMLAYIAMCMFLPALLSLIVAAKWKEHICVPVNTSSLELCFSKNTWHWHDPAAARSGSPSRFSKHSVSPGLGSSAILEVERHRCTSWNGGLTCKNQDALAEHDAAEGGRVQQPAEPRAHHRRDARATEGDDGVSKRSAEADGKSTRRHCRVRVPINLEV